MVRQTIAAAHRWDVASRVLAAIAGGYGLTWLVAAAVAPLVRDFWSVGRVESVLTGHMVSYLVYAVAVIAVFSARSATRAWTGLLVASAVPGIVLVLLQRTA